MEKEKIYRAFIDQPSKFQPLHKLHGKKGIVVEDYGESILMVFGEGDTISMIVPKICITKIWK